MRTGIFWEIYRSPLRTILLYIFLLVLIWAICSFVISRSEKLAVAWRLFNTLLFVVGLFFMIRLTLMGRSVSSRGAELVPFRSLIDARVQPELYREKLMNVFLYVPLGLTIPYLVETVKKLRCKAGREDASCMRIIKISMLTLAAISIAVEIMQWIFRLGLAETDDVLTNTLGGLIGVLAYPGYRNRQI